MILGYRFSHETFEDLQGKTWSALKSVWDDKNTLFVGNLRQLARPLITGKNFAVIHMEYR